MAEMKRLAKETAIYGVSSILGRFLNWCLVPFYTYVLKSSGEYGVVGELYAWTAILLVLLTYGMETGFFRFANKEDKDAKQIYSTTLTCLGFTSLLFILLCTIFLPNISNAMGYQKHPDFLWMMALTVAIDAFSCIPFAWLRYKKRPIMFAVLKLLMIFFNIFFNIFFLWICPKINVSKPELISWFYNPDYGVGYVFLANVISSVIGIIALMPFFIAVKWNYSKSILKEMLKYSLPLLILGVVGIMDQSIDKIMFPHLFNNVEEARTQLGIYIACFKIGIVMMMFTQAFRYAYEPFVFSKQRSTDNKKAYVEAMNYYVICSVFVFLGVMYFLDVLQYLLKSDYREGLIVVPIILICYIFQGIYFNLSFWYKLTDKTKWGAYISFIGLFITIAGNLLFVPKFGYIAAAWVSFFSFMIMMIVSWALGQKFYPIPYNLRLFTRYLFIGVIFYIAGMYIPIHSLYLRLGYRTILLLFFVLYVLKKDIPAGSIPFISKKVNIKA
jgi:O-antigen/teichoic acid export membrane protein